MLPAPNVMILLRLLRSETTAGRLTWEPIGPDTFRGETRSGMTVVVCDHAPPNAPWLAGHTDDGFVILAMGESGVLRLLGHAARVASGQLASQAAAMVDDLLLWLDSITPNPDEELDP